MYILGISAFYHDAAVCLLQDGSILYSAQEERFSRIKNDASFPAFVSTPKIRTGYNLEKHLNLTSMKKTKFTETQIVKTLKEAESGRSVADISRELGIHTQTFYNWKKKYSGMDGEHLKRLIELEEENRKLKSMYAEVSLDNRMLKDVLSKKW